MTNKRQKRVFSEELKRKIVKDIEEGKVSVLEASREYLVSQVSIYKWLDRYSKFLKKGAKLVVELSSEGYRSKELEKKVKDLEATLGRKQMEVEFLNKLIELASSDFGIDIKKKSFTIPSIGSDSIPKKGGLK
jgi:transposase